MRYSHAAICTTLLLGLTACGGGSGGGAGGNSLQVQVVNGCGEVITDRSTQFIFHGADGAVLGTADGISGSAPAHLPTGTRHLTIAQSRGGYLDPIPVLTSFINWNGKGIDTLTLNRDDLDSQCECRSIVVDGSDLLAQLGNYQLSINGFDLDWATTTSAQVCKHHGQWQPLEIVATPNAAGAKPYGALYPISDATADQITLAGDLMDAQEHQASDLQIHWSALASGGRSYFPKSSGDGKQLALTHDGGEAAFYFPQLGKQPLYQASRQEKLAGGAIYSNSVVAPIRDHQVRISLNDNSNNFVAAVLKTATQILAADMGNEYDLTDVSGNASELLVTLPAQDHYPLWTIQAPLSGTMPNLMVPADLGQQIAKHPTRGMLIATVGADKPMTLQAFRQLSQQSFSTVAGTDTPALVNMTTESLYLPGQ